MKIQKCVILGLFAFLTLEVGVAQTPRMETAIRMSRKSGQDELRGARYRKTPDSSPVALAERDRPLPSEVKLAGPARQRNSVPADLELADTVLITNPPMFGLGSSAVEIERGADASLLTVPVRGSTLATTQTFTWNSAGSGWYWLWVGSCQDCTDIADWDMGGNRSTAVNIPTDGRSIYVTLFTFSQGMWYWVDYRFEAPGARFSAPIITSPAEGSTLSTTQTIRWT